MPKSYEELRRLSWEAALGNTRQARSAECAREDPEAAALLVPLNRLRPVERAYVYLSTTDVKEIAERIRHNLKEALEDPYISHLVFHYNAALDKMARYRGTVYRGITLNNEAVLNQFLAQHKRGMMVVYDAFTHASRSMDVAERFGDHVLMVIESMDGKSIAQWSAKPWEQEVAFRLGTAFHITNVRMDGIRHIIEMTELEAG